MVGSSPAVVGRIKWTAETNLQTVPMLIIMMINDYHDDHHDDYHDDNHNDYHDDNHDDNAGRSHFNFQRALLLSKIFEFFRQSFGEKSLFPTVLTACGVIEKN